MSQTEKRDSVEGKEKRDVFKRAIFRRAYQHDVSTSRCKVSVIGGGPVSSAIAYDLCVEDLCGEVAVLNSAMADGDVLDLQHAAAWSRTRISGGDSYEVIKDSRICIVAATPSGGLEDTLEQKVAVFKSAIPPIVQHCPDCILLIATEPVETMTYVAWKLSNLPPSRVLGVGTVLDTAALRHMLGCKRLDVHPSNVQAVVSGNHHGFTATNWNGVHVSGTQLKDVLLRKIEAFDKSCNMKMSTMRRCIREDKGFSTWGTARCVVEICEAILHDSLEIMPVTCYVKGCHHSDKDSDVFMSMACVLCENGVHSIVKPSFSNEDRRRISEVAKQLLAVQKETGV